AVRRSDIVLVCLSSRSVSKRGYVQKEIKDALDTADEMPEGTIYIIPAKLEDCEVPDQLSRWQWVELFRATGYAKLLRALREKANELGRLPPRDLNKTPLNGKCFTPQDGKWRSLSEPVEVKRWRVIFA